MIMLMYKEVEGDQQSLAKRNEAIEGSVEFSALLYCFFDVLLWWGWIKSFDLVAWHLDAWYLRFAPSNNNLHVKCIQMQY